MIIDSHVHLVTAGMIKQAKKSWDKLYPGVMDRAMKKERGLINREMVEFLGRNGVESLARIWVEELDRNGIDRAFFLPIRGDSVGELDEFVSIHPERFTGYAMLDNPEKKSAVKTFRKWLSTGRIRGLKLYPCLQMVSIADKRLFPIYETAAEFNAPVLIHFGITHAPVSDYRYTNPMDLQLPSKLFPDTTFIMAHFGAGYFREALLLGFHSENIYLDTSGTNNWRTFLPGVMPLAEIFRRAIDVYGARKILYGTDTALNGKTGYRTFVLEEQRAALAEIGLDEEKRAMIMGGNAERLFGTLG
ncbi:MAG: amidohydrolase [Nitrospinae bacterium]|nr:amidohydrolase [Nitrospinota bacterium]